VHACSPVGEWAAGQVAATARNNAGLFDRNEDNQKLRQDDIMAMKAEGKVRMGYRLQSSACC